MPYKNPEDKKQWTEKEHRRRVLTGYYRDWKRKNQVGKVRVYGKRPYPGACEVCGRKFEDKKGQFAYHHWDDDAPQVGIYLCCTCHAMAEGIDHGRDEIYLRLKAAILLGTIGLSLEDFNG